MTAPVWAALSLLGTFLFAALGDLASDEIRGWLDLAPRLLLRLAAKLLLDPTQRQTVYHDEWLPELTYILHGAESRPITRLILAVRYSLGLLRSAHRISAHINRTPHPQTNTTQAAADLAGQAITRSGAIGNLVIETLHIHATGTVTLTDHEQPNPANVALMSLLKMRALTRSRLHLRAISEPPRRKPPRPRPLS